MKKLVNLNLDENQITEISASFSGLLNLRDLSMAKNKVTTIADGALKPLSNLVMLDLHQNNIKGVFKEAP